MRPRCQIASRCLNRFLDPCKIVRVCFSDDTSGILEKIFWTTAEQIFQTLAAIRHRDSTIGVKSKLIDGPWYSAGDLLQNLQGLIPGFFRMLPFCNVSRKNEKSDHVLICIKVRNIVHEKMAGLVIRRPIDAFKCDLLTRQCPASKRLHLLKEIFPQNFGHRVSYHLPVGSSKEVMIAIVGEPVTKISVDSSDRPWGMVGHQHKFAAAFFQSQLGYFPIRHILMNDDYTRPKPLHSSHVHIEPASLIRRITRILH